jgi:outer membrane protein OmpA-like peptidoglycan-associated protein
VLLACACFSLAVVHAADKPGAKDFPTISRFKGAEIAEYQAVDFDEAMLPIKPMPEEPVPPTALMKVEGRVTSIMYVMPAGKTPLEVMRNYVRALGASYKTVFSCAGDVCGRNMAGFIGNSGKIVPSGWGHMSFETDKNRCVLAKRSGPDGDVYLLLYAMQETNYPTTLFQRTVEVKPMQGSQVTVLDAAALQRGLETEGKVAVYGVLFDTAKADIKPESKASLDEMGKLLTRAPGLKVYIVGHTDNVGGLAANLELSQRRAEAVAKALASTYKIDPARLVARGVASLAPVTSNGAEVGRSRNRRVELVLQ